MKMIELNRLHLSALNVRKTERDADIVSLAADIAARGLKQNLVVVPGAVDGEYEVVAGGRRLQACQLLAGQGDMPADAPIPCLVELADQGTETSLAENLHKIAMNPADEFAAFKTIIDEAFGTEPERIAYCAKRFGVTEAHVRGRLRLAALSAQVLGALRAGAIGLGSAIAYAAVDDHALQDKVLAEQSKPNAWKPHDPSSIRQALAGKTYPVNDVKVRFVGLDAYREAGGRTDIDLFSTDATERLLDMKLLDGLVAAKAKAALPKLVKKHKLTDGVFSLNVHNAKGPDGWSSVSDWSGQDSKLAKRIAEKLPTIGLFSLDHDAKIELRPSMFFVPSEEQAQQPRHGGYVELTPEERAARDRDAGIARHAVVLALRAAGSASLDSRLVWPDPTRWMRINGSDEDEAGDVTVEVAIRLLPDEVEAQRGAAEAAYDEWKAGEADRRAAAEAALKAEAAQAEAMRAAAIEANPGVVEIEEEGGIVLYRRADGSYADVPEGSDDEADFGADSIADIASECTIVAHWPTVEAYEASLTAEAPMAEAA